MKIGVLGGGQLGRMLGLAGAPLGLDFCFLDPSPDAPAGAVGELVTAPWTDEAALGRLAGCDLVTFEFESVPLAAAAWLEQRVPVHPRPGALAVAQDRAAEKRCFRELGIPTPAFALIDDEPSAERAGAALGFPLIVKTRREGYDGKGQRRVATPAELLPAVRALGGRALIAEAFVPFEGEASILAARGHDGTLVTWPLVENQHQGGVLRCSRVPCRLETPALAALAHAHVSALLAHLDYVGVLCLELFVVGGTLLANEIAPRVHNSGHWTIEGARTSQFENHLRAILGWPLGSTEAAEPVGMLNAVGGLPAPERLLARPDVHLHHYAKAPRPGRKVAHVTARAGSAAALDAALDALAPDVPFIL